MSNDWTQVVNCNSLHEAHVMKSVLEAEGIEVMLPDEQMLGVQPVATAIGGARVLVHASDVVRAAELIGSAGPLPTA